MRTWPPIVWPLMTLASLLILAGSVGGWRPGLLVPGIFLALTVAGLSVYFVVRKPDKPRSLTWWAIGGLVAFYLLAGAVGALVGPEYALAAVLAGVVPLAALCLLLSMVSTAGDEDTPYPTIGVDHDTPLGDTSEHSDAPRSSFRGSSRP